MDLKQLQKAFPIGSKWASAHGQTLKVAGWEPDELVYQVVVRRSDNGKLDAYGTSAFGEGRTFQRVHECPISEPTTYRSSRSVGMRNLQDNSDGMFSNHGDTLITLHPARPGEDFMRATWRRVDA